MQLVPSLLDPDYMLFRMAARQINGPISADHGIGLIIRSMSVSCNCRFWRMVRLRVGFVASAFAVHRVDRYHLCIANVIR